MTSKLYKDNGATILPIPFTELCISRQGLIMDASGTRLRTFRKKNGHWVNLPVKDSEDGVQRLLTVRVATITSIVFKGYKHHWKLWPKIDLFFKDGDCFNVDPSNVAHQMYGKDFEVEYEGVIYKIIPNFTGYGIAKNGNVLKLDTKQIREGYRNNGGYHVHQIICDIHGRLAGSGRHRFLALCYKEYPSNVDELEVNHINHTPGDDWLDNLEWLTPLENTRHALTVGGGKLKDCRKVICYDIIDKEFKTYQSQKETERELGITNAYVSKCLDRNSYQLVHGRYRINLYNENEVYDENHPLATSEITLTDYMYHGTFTVEDMAGNTVWTGNNFKELENHFKTGRNPSNLGKGFKRGKVILPNHKLRITLHDYPPYYGGKFTGVKP